jgi:predicted TPR repeat methyltransferase
VSGPEGVRREDAEALLEVRRELGPSYDAALVDSFAERIERAVAERVDSQVAAREAARRQDSEHDGRQLALGIVSLGTGIPITAISATVADLPGLVVAWGGIVAVNVAYALRGRRRR